MYSGKTGNLEIIMDFLEDYRHFYPNTFHNASYMLLSHKALCTQRDLACAVLCVVLQFYETAGLFVWSQNVGVQEIIEYDVDIL